MTYSPQVSALLAARENHRMPLVQSGSFTGPAATLPPHDLFPNARFPEAAQAGLVLYLGGWEQAHNISQNIDTPEGSYWHAIVHRQEPDAGNAAYWFNLVGQHPIFDELAEDARAIAPGRFAGPWNPQAFIDFCASPANLQAALAIQHAEWQRLLHWCAAIQPE